MDCDKQTRRSDCPISYSLDIFGDKWTLLIIRDLVFTHKKHFREFLSSAEQIASNILADRFKRLEACGIVVKRPDPESGRRVIYELTDKGLDLIPVLLEIIRWGATHDAHTGAPKDFVRQISKDREALIDEIRSGMTKK